MTHLRINMQRKTLRCPAVLEGVAEASAKDKASDLRGMAADILFMAVKMHSLVRILSKDIDEEVLSVRRVEQNPRPRKTAETIFISMFIDKIRMVSHIHEKIFGPYVQIPVQNRAYGKSRL